MGERWTRAPGDRSRSHQEEGVQLFVLSFWVTNSERHAYRHGKVNFIADNDSKTLTYTESSEESLLDSSITCDTFLLELENKALEREYNLNDRQ